MAFLRKLSFCILGRQNNFGLSLSITRVSPIHETKQKDKDFCSKYTNTVQQACCYGEHEQEPINTASQVDF